MDGTLLDTLKDLALSVNAVLISYGFEGHPVDAYRYYVGDGIDLLVRRAFPKDLLNRGVDKLVQAVKEEYSRRWADHTVPYEGIPELLDYLDRNHIPKGIFSNKPHEFALLTVEKLLANWKFIDIIGIGVEMPKKPDPRGALNIAGEMGFEPAQIVYLGDTSTDMQTALNGGFYPVGALWGFRSADELISAGAVRLVKTPSEVIELFS